MKIMAAILFFLSSALVLASNQKGDKLMQAQLGTSIQITAAPGKEEELAKFLKGGASVVEQTEPGTLQWFAVDEGNGQFRIIDFFGSEKGRKEHFDGKVAAALAENARVLVKGAWEQGVVSNIKNSRVLASFVRNKPAQEAKLSTFIKLKAKPGKEEELAAFLKAGADIVKQSEPQTYLWYALRIDKSNFAIYDVFPDQAARNAHFSGKVAHALKEKARDLVEGSWEKGVLANVIHAKIISDTF